MASQGPNNGGTFGNDTTVGAVAWANPGNAQSSDDAWATRLAGAYPETTNYLKATNFGFAIPVGVTILGIQVDVERKGADAKDSSIKIVKGGAIGGDEKAIDAYWPAADAYKNYGGATDLWGVSWTPANINASTFGVVVSAYINATKTGYIDHIRITVTYKSKGQVIMVSDG